MKLFIKKQLQKNSLWSEVKKIILKISQHQFVVLVAGGSVRDALINRAIKDIDLATSATPEQIIKIFPKSNSSFAKYGTVFIPLKNKQKLEITTFRRDSSRSDGRRPQSVEYSSIKEDAYRRDFTINALFYDLKEDKLIDLVKGLKDLENKKIRAVGEAEKRFKEDYLRMLRALRLAHQLNFKLDKEIKYALLKLSKHIRVISKERILDELMKMFSTGKIDCIIKKLNDYGFFQYIFPQLALHLSNLNFKDSHFQKKKGFDDKFKKISINQKYFKFWKKSFSFYQEPAFCWTLIALPFFYSDIKSFSAFLKSYPMKNAVIKQSLSYLNAVQTLIDLNRSFTEQLIVLNGQKKQVFELTYNLLEADILKNKHKIKTNLKFILKEFSKREIKNHLPQPLVKGSDLLKLSPVVKRQNFSKILKRAFICQMKYPKINKQEILKKLGYKLS